MYTCQLYRQKLDLNKIDNIEETERKMIEKFPDCLKFRDMLIYMWMPTMCFQLNFPKTTKINKRSLAMNLLKLIIVLIFSKIIVEQYLYKAVVNTVNEMNKYTKLDLLIYLYQRFIVVALPNTFLWLLLFLVVFHYWPNVLAELTYFEDRVFYKDWWNAISFSEYWRKWNLPVHRFILRHIYFPLEGCGIKREYRVAFVFLLSAFIHEYLIMVPLGLRMNGLIFLIFLIQAPLTLIKFSSSYRNLGNFLFWLSFCFFGQPFMIILCYSLWLMR